MTNTSPASASTVGQFGKFRWSMGAILLLAFLLWVPRLSGPIDLRWDAGVYYVLGTSLANGDGYRLINEPGSPHGIQYPPLLPVIVAAHQRVLGTSDPAVVGPWLRHTYFALFLAYAGSVLVLARVFLRPLTAFVAAALSLMQLMAFFLSDSLFSELPFALVGVFFVLVAKRDAWRLRPGIRDPLLYALGVAGFLLRTAGLALLAAWVFEAMMRRQWRAMIVRGVLAVLPVAGWQAYVSHVRSSDEYAHPAYAYQRAPYQFYNVSYAENARLVDPFAPELGPMRARDAAARLGTNILAMPQSLGESVSEPIGWWNWALIETQQKTIHRRVLPGRSGLLITNGLGVLVLAGLALLAFRREWMLTGVLLATMALVCATPWPGQFTRYLSVAGPFLIVAFLLAVTAGHGWLASHLRGRLRIVALCVSPAMVAVIFWAQAFTVFKTFSLRKADGLSSAFRHGAQPQHLFFFRENERPTWSDWEQAVDWIGAHSPADAVVSTTSPHLCFLRNGRRAVMPPMEKDATLALKLLEDVPVSYVIVDELAFLDISRRYALPAMELAADRWRVVFTQGKTSVYERVVAAH